MAKNVFKATDEKLNDLYEALRSGAPLPAALKYAGISRATYNFWLAAACVVEQSKTQTELEDIEEILHSGISIQQVRDISETSTTKNSSTIGGYIEPSAESVLAYKNNRKFKKFADKCYEVIKECDKIRSKLVLVHLTNIKESVNKSKGLNASGSMWYLERTMPDYFGRPVDKLADQSNDKVVVEPVRVEYVDPDNEDTKKRVAEMEQDLLKAINGEGNA